MASSTLSTMIFLIVFIIGCIAIGGCAGNSMHLGLTLEQDSLLAQPSDFISSVTPPNAMTSGVGSIGGRETSRSPPAIEDIFLFKPAGQRTTRLSNSEECARTCRIGDPPKTCYYNFVVEYYTTLSSACNTCNSNDTTRLIDDCQCIVGDGVEISGIITVNRMFPGPPIIVCKNDYVVVDLQNLIPGNGVTIHWHGIPQKGYQYYDGVPYVTQCPVEDGTTFRYQWKAMDSGTFFWHAHTGLHKLVGFEGALVVREPKSAEPSNLLWDTEDINHIIFIADWLHEAAEQYIPGNIVRKPDQLPDNFLINGRGTWTDPATGRTTTAPRAIFKVKPGRRYRFRLINGLCFTCPVTLTIERHALTVFAMDGNPVVPFVVNSITSFSAERYDFVVTAESHNVGDFWIQVRGIGPCATPKLQQLAVLRYESTTMSPSPKASPEPSYEVGLTRGVVLNELNVRCENLTEAKNFVCVPQLMNDRPVPPRILKPLPDVQFYLPFGFYSYNEQEAFVPGKYNKFLVNGAREFASRMSNISNVFPPSTLISQLKDNPPGQICSPDNLPANCVDGPGPCFCTSVQEIPLNAVVELILVDEAQVPGLSHPFHLHGFTFFVLSEGCGDDYNVTSINVKIAKDLDLRGKFVRNMHRPPAKDTFAVPNNGFSIIRFIADNPGYWLFHCHFLPHLGDGMSTIFHVGTPWDLPPVPRGFPTCGNFLPRIEA